MRFHLIGICGAGMSAVAKLLIESGHTITGSDEGFYPPISDYLVKNNIPCLTPFNKNNIPEDVDAIVIGKHAKLVPEENEEVAAAFATGKPILSFPQVLQQLSEKKDTIVVAGSYGKSTCTSLLSWCLEQAGKDPSYFIGALPLTPQSNAHIGHGSQFVIEGDEYPSSNWDHTSKFLFLKPRHTLITALAHDHVNIFPTHAEYLAPFKKLITQVDNNGVLVMCLDDTTIASQLETIERPVITYGLGEEALYHGKAVSFGTTTTCDLMRGEEYILTLETSLLGKHNLQNCIGVAALLLETGLLTPEEIKKGIQTFKGIVRRLDKKSEKTSIPVYEGFGSSVDKARSAIDAMKLHFPDKKLLVIFEPHTFSWRNRQALHWYDTVFAGASQVLIYKPPEHGKETHEQLHLDEIVDRVTKTGLTTTPFITPEEGVERIKQYTDKETVILILSSGGMDGLLPRVLDALETEFPSI